MVSYFLSLAHIGHVSSTEKPWETKHRLRDLNTINPQSARVYKPKEKFKASAGKMRTLFVMLSACLIAWPTGVQGFCDSVLCVCENLAGYFGAHKKHMQTICSSTDFL